MTDATPYTIPKEPGGWRSFTLAVLVHLALVALLWIGVRWQNETPMAVEAEIWNPQTQQAAPKPQPEPEAVQPPPTPAPRVVETPKPQPAPQVERPVEKPVQNPDIALEQEKKRRLKEEKERREREEEEREEREDRAQQKKLAQQKQDQAEARKKDQAKADAERQRKLEEQQAAQKREAEEDRKRELADARKKELAKAEADKKRAQAQAQAKAEAEAAEQRRIEDLSRMTAQATGSGGSGQAARSQGASRADAGYAAKVGGKIRSNTVFNVPDELANNPAVEYAVDLLPDGSVRGIRKIKGSGVPGFDEAVRRAIEKSQPFPPDNSGRAPSGFTVSHKPKDQ
jgi:colicin import membrane protein